MTTRLGTDDYAVDPAAMAQRLIGCRLVRALPSGDRLSGVIVETEAYLGVKDRASHAFGGRRTARNESMYGPPGTAYVYFTYGMHHCMNVVCGEPDEPVAALLRALIPVEGVERMRKYRAARTRRSPLIETDLCSGPGKLCQALAIDRGLDGVDLGASGGLFIEPSTPAKSPSGRIVRARRVGVDEAGRWARRLLRFYLADSRYVSRK